MHTNVQSSSINAYRAQRGAGRTGAQCEIIMAHIRECGDDWTIGELAHALDMEKSTVSARVYELLHAYPPRLVDKPKRKDRVSGIKARPVALPSAQLDLLK